MTETRRCPQCGTELPADSPEGICPNCVFQMGLGSTPAASPGSESGDPGTVGEGEAAAAGAQVPPSHSQQATVVGGGFIPPPADEMAKLFPQFEILELLGKGGMGAVYKARQPTLDRMVAVKILPPAVAADPAFAERFTREARALARLNHPHIVSVYDFGHVQGQYYFVMEYVDGANLRTAIETARLSAAEALAIVPQICEALQYAHDEGVVHRDIKPENILIDKRGRVKIADFGLAKIVGLGSADDSGSLRKRDFTLTGTHQVMGTMHYMAPEQIEKPQTVDHRADIYSLGVVFYEMLTGELPIGRFAPPSQKVEMDVRLDEVVLRSLEKEPDRRYQHASDVKTEIETIGRGPVLLPVPSDIPAPRSDRQELPVDLESARRQVNGPAIGLIIAGSCNLLLVAVVLLVGLWDAGWRFGFPRPKIRAESHAAAESLLRSVVAPPTSKRFGVPVCAAPNLAAQFVLGQVQEEAPPGMGPIRLYLGMAALGAIWGAVGILTIIGAVKMRRLELYPLAVIATVTAMLPCSPGSLIGFPCGIWALVVLCRADVRAAFEQVRKHGQPAKPAAATTAYAAPARPAAAAVRPNAGESGSGLAQPIQEVDLESARRQARGPALGLFWTGLFTVTIGLIVVLWSGWTLQRIGSAPKETTTTKQGATTVTFTPQLDRYPSPSLLWLILIGQAVGVAAGGIMIQSASSMARLKDYPLACRGSLLAKLPLSPAWLIGLPLGLRCQAVLARPEIREAFDRPFSPVTAQSECDSPTDGGLFPQSWTTLTWTTSLVSLAGALATFLPWLKMELAGFESLLPGYDGWYGLAAGFAFLAAFLVGTLVELRQMQRSWRVGVNIAAAVTVITLTGMFLYEVAHPRITSSSPTGDLAGNSALVQSLEELAKSVLFGSMKYSLHMGAFVSLACGIALLGLALVELLQRRAGALAWKERWRACPQVVRTIVYSVLCLVYLAATFTFLGFHASSSKSGSRTEIGAPVPWVTSYNQHEAEDGRPVGFAMGINLLSPSILFGIGGGCAYWLYWKLRIVEEGTISRWESPVIQVVLWTICIAIGISVCFVRMLR